MAVRGKSYKCEGRLMALRVKGSYSNETEEL